MNRLFLHYVDMNEPPAMPEIPRPIRRAEFVESKSVSFGGTDFNYKLIRASHDKAEKWINANSMIEIVQIETFGSSLSGITVVWYR